MSQPNPREVITHEPGQELYVDWAGDKVPVVDQASGDTFNEIIGTQKLIEPTAKLGVLVLCLVRRTRLR